MNSLPAKHESYAISAGSCLPIVTCLGPMIDICIYRGLSIPIKNMQQILILMQAYTIQIKADRALSDVSIMPRPTQQKSLAAQ